MLFVICILTALQAYVVPWVIPTYKKLEAATPIETQVSTGFMYLMILAATLTLIAVTVMLTKRKHGEATITPHKIQRD
jgi:type II secretory pathway component PulF